MQGKVKWYNDARIKKKNFESRFFNKVKKTKSCWFWNSSKTNGYGTFTVYDGKCVKAHRVSFFISNKFLPDKGLVLDHTCRNRSCVKPTHLEVVTQKVNCQRGFQGQKKYCVKGHKRNKKHTHIRPNGTKYCKTCQNINQKRRYHARKNQVV